MQLQQYGGQHTIHSRKSRGPLYSCALEEQLDLNIESLAVTLTASQPQIRLETSLFDDLIQEKDEKKAILTASLNEFDFKAIGHAIRQKLLQYYYRICCCTLVMEKKDLRHHENRLATYIIVLHYSRAPSNPLMFRPNQKRSCHTENWTRSFQ